jgi:hypothetical protein
MFAWFGTAISFHELPVPVRDSHKSSVLLLVLAPSASNVGKHAPHRIAQGSWEMKALLTKVVFCLLLSRLSPLATEAFAMPIDLSTFQSDTGSLPTNGSFQFVEGIHYFATSLHNDAFQVSTQHTVRSFDHAFALGAANQNTLFVKIADTTCASKLEQSGNGRFEPTCRVLA